MKTAAVLSVVLLTGASIWLGGCSGCGGCHGETPVPTVVPTTSEAAAAGATAAVVPEQGGEVDCFVIVDADPDFGAPPLTVNFTTETDCTGSPVTFSWDFGDGTKGGNDPKPSHAYQKAGDYIATVTVTAPDGGSGTDEIDLTVDEDLAE